jgi:hypothetical protein
MADHDQPLRCIRIIQRGSALGPLTFEVHSLWDTNVWRVKTFTSHTEAMQYRNTLLEGLASVDDTRVIWQWNCNEPPEGIEA